MLSRSDPRPGFSMRKFRPACYARVPAKGNRVADRRTDREYRNAQCESHRRALPDDVRGALHALASKIQRAIAGAIGTPRNHVIVYAECCTPDYAVRVNAEFFTLCEIRTMQPGAVLRSHVDQNKITVFVGFPTGASDKAFG